MKKNIILADCEAEEVQTFKEGLEQATGMKFHILSNICNKGHGSAWKKFKRYANYFAFPLKIFFNRKNYNIIVGWQQFYANIFAFYCHLFHVKKGNLLVSVNFTYKKKPGIIGSIYYRFMKFGVNNKYMDYLHVLSLQYADRCASELGIDRKQFLVTTFGIPDEWQQWRSSEAPLTVPYVLSIGRSNRDFDFLARVWARPEMADIRLVLIADTYKPAQPLTPNVTHLTNVTGDLSKPWTAHCSLMMIPIADGNLASGDTVLLTGMQFKKVVVISKPSTLAEMYIVSGEDGIALEKDEAKFAEVIRDLMENAEKRDKIGENARQSYLQKFSRVAMGRQLGRVFAES